MSVIVASISAARRYVLGQPIKMTFSLTNTGQDAAQILKWLTPLEGLESDCLSVLRDGVPVPYDGILLRRGAPGADAYVTLEPGQSTDSDFELQSAYSVSLPGVFDVSYLGPITAVVVGDEERSPVLDLQASGRRANSIADELSPSGASARFLVEGAGPGLKTIGEQAREEERIMPQGGGPVGQTPADAYREPTFQGSEWLEYEKKLVTETDLKGLELSKTAQTWFESGPSPIPGQVDWFEKWFGILVDSDKRVNTVKTTLALVVAGYGKNLTYEIDLQCKQGVLAHTKPGSTTVSLCAAFFTDDPNGQVDTLFHERTHVSADTKDWTYSKKGCEGLAMAEPDEAVLNGESYVFFLRNKS